METENIDRKEPHLFFSQLKFKNPVNTFSASFQHPERLQKQNIVSQTNQSNCWEAQGYGDPCFPIIWGKMCVCGPIIQVETESDCAITNSNGEDFYSGIMQINLHVRYSLSPLQGGWCWSHHQPNQQLDSGCLRKRWMEKMDNLKVSGSEESWHYPWGQQSHRRPLMAPRKHQKKDKTLEFWLSYKNGDLSQVPSASCSKTRLCCGCTDFATVVLVTGQGVLACFILKKELISQITPDFLSMAVVLHC